MSNTNPVVATLKGYTAVMIAGVRTIASAIFQPKRARATSPSSSVGKRSRVANVGVKIENTEIDAKQQIDSIREWNKLVNSPSEELKAVEVEQIMKRAQKQMRESMPDFKARFGEARNRIITERIDDLAKRNFSVIDCIKQIRAEYRGLDLKTTKILLNRSGAYGKTWEPTPTEICELERLLLEDSATNKIQD